MANTKQAIKMIRKIKRKTAYNRTWKNKIKSAVKALGVTLSENSEKDISSQKVALQKRIDKAVKSGVIHKNKGNRMKSKIFKNRVS